MASRFIVSNPALAPLFVAVGAGMVGASWFGFHVLKNNQEVLIARGTNPTPWNNVRQDQNTKASRIPPPPCPPGPIRLYSPNAEFWKSRVGMPDPRSAFAATTDAVMKAEMKVQDVALKASAKVHEIKERAVGR
ncbi:NADH-ubiquinone reductase complex 1 MLRQ subunit [Rhizoctonia solani]|uniref:NADH-ubiquinone reductase complex 1 MLRQ subunit n=2 Tax=Rhizoctonia solani TaxID=456999 RepID=A0A8H7HDR0_9AGAM|nr:NADH-ubiquinone reductase complex 1 MLRQ subunit [Rhizoctonia solani]KAF8756160.1 NADH-ubiquinone reductase complex 1 MLRQ subunit [Rhizoctonia solani]